LSSSRLGRIGGGRGAAGIQGRTDQAVAL
jgi:hypothetical protein